MRISDWSSDVCSSDLICALTRNFTDHAIRQFGPQRLGPITEIAIGKHDARSIDRGIDPQERPGLAEMTEGSGDRKTVVSGKSVSVSVHLGSRRILKKNKKIHNNRTHFRQ